MADGNVKLIAEARQGMEAGAYIRRLQGETELLKAEARKLRAEAEFIMARHNLEQAQEEARRRLDRAERKTRMRARLVSAWRKFWAKPE